MRSNLKSHRRTRAAQSTLRRGFTLVEILIVIAIIGILAAILFPVFGRVRERGRTATCSSNMKQLGIAFIQYQQDAGGRLPGAARLQKWQNPGNWVMGPADQGLADNSPPFNYKEPFTANVEAGALYPYVKNAQVYVCPSTEDSEKKHLGYSMNCAISGIHTMRIKEPSVIVLLVDEGKSLNDGFFYASSNTNSTDELTKAHLGGGNLLFHDGHVKFFPFDVFPLDKNPKGLENKGSLTATPRFRDKAFGPNGANYGPRPAAGTAQDYCFEDIP